MKVEPMPGTAGGTSAASHTVMALRRVHVSLGPAAQVEALHDVSLNLCAGERVALVGPNGCGKSTLLRTLHGLLPISSGERAVPLDLRMAMLFQRPHMLRMSVLRNLQLGLWLAGTPWGQTREQACRSLRRVGLSELAERNGRALSGGQQQRVALARAWSLRPDIWLLDEPTAGLSPMFMSEIFDRVLAINATGVTIAMVEQNAKQALAIAHKGFVLANGANSWTDTGKALLANPEVARSFLGGP